MMKKSASTILITIFSMTCCLAQEPYAGKESIGTQLLRMEHEGWQAWKDKDASWFQKNTTDEFVTINGEGVTDKATLMQTLNDCKVDSFSIDKFQFVMLDEDVVLLTYTAYQEAMCGGMMMPKQVRVAVTYVRRVGAWQEAVYVETPMK